MNGYNGTVFAYGQTSSGKTHTMMGSAEEPGVIRQAVDQLFLAVEQITDRAFLMEVSYLEIYNENVVDLLADQQQQPNYLKIREKETGEVFVEAAKIVPVGDSDDVLSLMEQVRLCCNSFSNFTDCVGIGLSKLRIWKNLNIV